jgi:hypothetical protein
MHQRRRPWVQDCEGQAGNILKVYNETREIRQCVVCAGSQ